MDSNALSPTPETHLVNAVSREDPWVSKAYAIALMAHEPDAAEAAVVMALSLLDAQTDVSKRTIRDREQHRREETGLVLFGAPLLQRVLLYASDSIAQEMGNREISATDDATLLARYLQYLVLLCMLRSSRWAAVAIMQFVYAYKGTDIDNLVAYIVAEGWDNRKKAKRKLIEYLEERFSSLRVVKETGKQDRHFTPLENQEPFRELLSHWLTLFTPWTTDHLLAEEIPKERDPDVRDLKRFHIIVCPPCFNRLIARLGYDDPADVIRLPKMK